MAKKCIVLDLDNTLWGGVVGEDGFDGIQLGLEDPGASFVAFQQALLDLHNQGIILAINSKNNYEDAIDVIKNHPFMVLREKNFAAMRINWNDKDQNMREIAEELNIGLDSLVFLDDDPVNRSLLRTVIPEVETPDFPDKPEAYTKFVMGLPYFKSGIVTNEDKMRVSMYVTERLRMGSEKNFSSRDEFLHDLGMEVMCYEDDTSCIPRLSQMTHRTNQFNVNKRPMQEDEVSRYIHDPDYHVLYVSAHDKFGDYGIIGFALAKRESEVWVLEAMLMSCRALGRGIEEAFLHFLAMKTKEDGKKALHVIFKKSEKNKPAQEFLKRYFKEYWYDVNSIPEPPSWVRIVRKNART